MDDVLSILYNQFEPDLPADPEGQYVSTDEARGTEALAPYFIHRLVRKGQESRHLNFTFSGHIGGGKSSELKHLAFCLRKSGPKLKGKRYLPIYLNIEDYVDVYNVTVSDLLLAIASEIGDVFREDKELKVELGDVPFMARLRSLWQMLPKRAEAESIEPSIGGAKLKIRLLKSDPSRRDEVRKALAVDPTTFLDELNSVIQVARIEARQRGFEDLVLLVDSLDKIEKTPTHPDPLEAHVELFLNNALTFTQLRVHKVLTFNLSFVRAQGPELGQRYGKDAYVLPLIKVEDRDHERYEAGYDALKRLFEQRTRGLDPFESLIESEAFEYLAKYSGGHPRLFTRFVNEAIAETESLPIDLAAARRAVRPTVANLIPAVHEDWWTTLAKLERHPTHQVREEDLDVQRMMDMTMILEYRNGFEDDTEFEESAPWYAVHPILRQTRSFKAALADLDAERLKDDAGSRTD